MASSTKRVLIYRLGSLGDTLIALPALHLVARAFPDAERRLLTNFPVNAKAPPAAAILENTDLVHGYFRYAAGTRSPRELLSLWWQLLRWRPAGARLHGPGSRGGIRPPRRQILSPLRNLSPHWRSRHRRHAAEPLGGVRSRLLNPKERASPAIWPN